ncbi:MAG: CU044_2847 family protein [Crocosphaera sp.]|nr:CU044_2847 family protein [Crocosphaera sp.]
MAIAKSISKIGGEEVVIYIEVNDDFKPLNEDEDDPLLTSTRSRGSQVIQATGDLFGDGLALTRTCAAKVIESVKQMGKETKPTELQIQLGITLDSEAGVPMLAKAGVNAQMQVTMKWTLKED